MKSNIDNEYFLVRVRPAFQVVGILLSASGILALAGVFVKYDEMVSAYGVKGLAIMLGLIVPFCIFIGICSTIGRLPYFIAKHLPDDLLHTMKDCRSEDDILIK